MAYEDDVADIIANATSPLENPEEDEQQGVATLASVGSPALDDASPATPFGTGRFSENGNELPPGLYSGARSPSGARGPDTDQLNNVPDTQYAEATGKTVPGSPVTPATVVPANSAPSAGPDYAQAGFQGELDNLRHGDKTTRMMEAQPSEGDTIRPLQETLAAASVPVNPHQRGSTAPGQPYQENYRPSAGDRILRGVKGGLLGVLSRGVVGGVAGAVDPAIEGVKPYGAGNANYDQEVARRGAVVTNTQQRIVQAQQAFKDRQAQLKDQGASEQAQSLGYSRLPTGVAGQQNALSAAARAKADQQRADQESPAGKAAVQDAEYKRIDTQNNDPKSLFSKLPDWAKAYRLGNGGKVPEGIKGREATEGEIGFNRAYRAWQADNPGKKASVDDIADITAKSKGQQAPSDKATEQQTRDSIRTATSRLATAARALGTAQKATQGFVPKSKQQDVQTALDKAQREFDAATEKLNGIGQEPAEQIPGGGQPNAPARAPSLAPATRKIVTADKKVHTAVVRNGRWVDQTTGQPL